MSGNPRDDAEEKDPISALSSVGSLMEERLRYEAWIQALNARRAETPKHVFTRVHADYTARLESVVSRLTGQVEALRGELTTLATRIATLDELQHRARDERAEAELRAHVGELSSEAWKEVAAESDARVAKLAKQHAEATEALRRTKEFLSDAERPATPPDAAKPVAAALASRAPAPPAPAPPAPAAQAPAGPAAAAKAPAPAAPQAPKPRQTASAPVQSGTPKLRPLPGREGAAPPAAPAVPGQGGGGGNFDELAFLSSVVDESANGEAAAPAPAAPPPRPSTSVPQQRTTTSVPSVGPPPRPSAPAPSAAPRPSVPSRNPFAARAQDKIVNTDGAPGPKIEPSKVGARSPMAANVSGNNPIVLRDKSNESAKTLKCGECGAQNYPTEWYCERCGAELASL